ncbi:hypothetical protein GCM10010909_01340 [Acidocella aquatica]|uniref:DUF1329 domain-containing protein n=1 Tax=Acidocella aquatica TaxID=1922313 RepID=A0ABQ6A0W7_9PROT|nr:DUF1329 domain-containing protein [Acidocella aquatica]GLR65456.1 hypothetical protein GCM10010909_01340 [Acidocella aquatica]
MKRRTFGLLAGTSLAALKVGTAPARAAAADPSLLTTTLTPTGAERAGNADGSIPAWTGGMTTLPAGLNKNDYIPELFPDEQPVVVIDASNMADHADRLSEGVKAMMTKYGFKIKVYPTHRTAAAPQYVYDNITKNVTGASFTAQDPVGGRFGFQGAYGGVPFPIPDTTNPLTAGAQVMWNHSADWHGFCFMVDYQSWSVTNGQKSMAYADHSSFKFPYYDPNGSLATFDGRLEIQDDPYTGPANLIGQAIIVWQYSNPYKNAQSAWELLNGQGRVRRAPEVSFDTPSPQSNGVAGYDEYFGFNGSLERYDWKLLGKKEMYIPYNNNALYAGPAPAAHLDHFLDPDLVRWELHRCWVVEATLHPGERNVLARRRYYHDEDTWSVGVGDMWDANNNLFKVNLLYNNCRPDLPGVVFGNNSIHNLQTDDYVTVAGHWNQAKKPTLIFVDNIQDSVFDPNNMAASAQY